jgi:hypothetical protein
VHTDGVPLRRPDGRGAEFAADGGELVTMIKDKRLRWPGTFAEDPDGSIYVRSSRIQDMAWYKPETDHRSRPCSTESTTRDRRIGRAPSSPW